MEGFALAIIGCRDTIHLHEHRDHDQINKHGASSCPFSVLVCADCWDGRCPGFKERLDPCQRPIWRQIRTRFWMYDRLLRSEL